MVDRASNPRLRGASTYVSVNPRLPYGSKTEAWARRTTAFLLHRTKGEKMTDKAREGAHAAREKAQEGKDKAPEGTAKAREGAQAAKEKAQDRKDQATKGT